jgi:hypothetical protein
MLARLKTRIWWFIYSAAKAAMEAVLEDDAADIKRQIQRDAMKESARYVLEHFELHKVYADREVLLERCLELIPHDGLILEFGVYRGGTILKIAARLPDRQVFGFDSFEGLPEPWFFFSQGIFSDRKGVPSMPNNVILIKGLFQDTSSDFLTKHPGSIAFLHVDSDLYSSCKFVLETYGERIRPQTIILFDEFYNYPTWMEGEFKAFHEWCDAVGARYEIIGFTARPGVHGKGRQPSGQQVAVRILGLDGPSHSE